MKTHGTTARLSRLPAGAMIAIIVGACGGSAATSAPSASSAPPAATSASAAPSTQSVSFDLKYGSLMSSTGDLAATGATWNHTIDLAMLTISNALKAQGLDGKIKLEKFAADDGGTAATGVEGANLLVKSDGASVILGPCCSGVTVAVAQGVTIAANVPMFTIGSSPTISALDSKGTVFRTTPADNLQGGALAQFVSQTLGAGKMVNIGARNDAYGQGLATEFTKFYTALGGTVGVTVQWDPKQATFDTEAQKLVSNSPDGWVFFDYEQSFINVSAALARTGKFDGTKSFGADSLACNAGTVAVNKSCGAPLGMKGTQASVTGGSGYPFMQQVLQAHLDPKVSYQGTFEPEGWDAVYIAFLAALYGNSAAPADIVKNIHAVTDPGGTEYTAEHIGDAIKDIVADKKVKYVGATGPCVFNAQGDVSTSTFTIWWQQAANVAATYGAIPDIQYSPK